MDNLSDGVQRELSMKPGRCVGGVQRAWAKFIRDLGKLSKLKSPSKFPIGHMGYDGGRRSRGISSLFVSRRKYLTPPFRSVFFPQ